MCDGYAEAYATYVFNEACTANPLYDSECPGYDAAYLHFNVKLTHYMIVHVQVMLLHF